MLTRKWMLLLLVTVTCTCVASVGHAKKHTVYVDDTALQSYPHADETRGSYYTLQFQIPKEVVGKTLYGVILEFYMDVSGEARDETSIKVPILEVYALENAFTGSLETAGFKGETGTILNVAPGNDRRLRIDITEIVRNYLKSPSTNHGLIIGGLADYREGALDLKANSIQGKYIAKIDFHYDARSGNN